MRGNMCAIMEHVKRTAAASMRPPHNAGEYTPATAQDAPKNAASMRPPHNAGEYGFGHRILHWKENASMRPPHNAGEYAEPRVL